MCKAPVITSSDAYEKMTISITVDGVNLFSSNSEFVFIKKPTITGVDNLKLPLTSKAYISILGSDFYNTGEFLSCRMKLGATEKFDLKAEFVSSTKIRCLSPPSYMVPLSGVELYISYNRFDYSNLVTSFIQYVESTKIYSLDKFYGIANADTEVIEITGEGLTDATLVSVSDFATDIAFTVANDTSGTFVLPSFVNISSITSELYSYLCSYDSYTNIKYSNQVSSSARSYLVYDESSIQKHRFYITTKDEYGWTCSNRYPRSPIEVGIDNLEYSSNGISYQFFSEPTITVINPTSVFKDSPVDLVVSGSGFWNTDNLSCRIIFGATGNTLIIAATYLNSTDVICSFPGFNDTNTYSQSVLQIQISLNGNWNGVQNEGTAITILTILNKFRKLEYFTFLYTFLIPFKIPNLTEVHH